jgi:hypothetical protein
MLAIQRSRKRPKTKKSQIKRKIIHALMGTTHTGYATLTSSPRKISRKKFLLNK